jgi:flagellin
MSLRINYNLASSVAQRSMNASQDTYARMAERLSTGLRINKSSDDAAGMAVSERLKNQVRGLNMAGRNAQDGVSLIQTAEGALAETHNILARLRELAVQAANDTLTATDRANLQTEANQLVSEIDRIAASTQFNGIYLLNKNSNVSLHDAGDGLQFQIGANQAAASNQVTVTVAGVRAQDLGDVTVLNQIDTGITATGANTFSVGGTTGVKYNAEVDTVFDVKDAINAGTATHGVTASIKNSKLRLEATVTGKTIAADSAATAGTGMVDQLFGAATNTLVNTTTGTTTLEDVGLTTSGTLTIVAGVDAGTGGAASTATLQEIGVTAAGTLTITATEGGATETATVAYTLTDTIAQLSTNIQNAMRSIGQVAGSSTGTPPTMAGVATATYTSGVLTLATTVATTVAVTDSNGDGGARAVFGLTGATSATLTGTAVNTAAQTETITVSYATTDTISGLATNIQTALRAAGSIGNSTLSTGTLAAATATVTSGILTLTSNGAAAKFSTIASSTDGTTTNALRAALNLAAAPAAVTAASTSAVLQNKFRVDSNALTGITSVSSGTGGILDIGTQTAASASISTVDSAINQVSTARAGLGAMQSRLESASRSIAIASENASAANSRIADADIAQSMSDLVRAQILQQAGISVLAQANQAPSLVLQLLK